MAMRGASRQSPSQPTLGGIEDPVPRDRLFFAVFPDAPAAACIAALAASLRAAHGLRGKPQREDRLHVTLFHLGDFHGVPEGLAGEARGAAAKVVMPPFDIRFDGASSFTGRPGNHPFVLRGGDAGIAGVASLHAALGDRLGATLPGKSLKPGFVPHVTLLYDDRVVAPRAIEPVEWTVREFVLVHSLVGRTEHRILDRWRLA
jgi:2'-5' RNA ligase